MRLLLLICFIYFPSMSHLVEVPGDFWDKCPGPACPSNKPSNPSIDDSTQSETWERDRIEREKELLDRERYLLDREMRIREREL